MFGFFEFLIGFAGGMSLGFLLGMKYYEWKLNLSIK